MVLLTREEVADILGISDTSIPWDVVTWAEEEVKKLTGKSYTEVSTSKTFCLRMDKQAYLDLPDMYITEVTKIEYSTDNGDTWNEIVGEYWYFEDEGIVVFDFLLTELYLYKVTYKYGSCAVDPLEKKLQLLLVFKYLLNYKPDLFTGDTETKQEKIGDYSITYNVQSAVSKPELINKDIAELKRVMGAGDGFSYGMM